MAPITASVLVALPIVKYNYTPMCYSIGLHCLDDFCHNNTVLSLY